MADFFPDASDAPMLLIAHASMLEAKQVAAYLAPAGMRCEAMAMDDAAIEEALSGHYAALIILASCEADEDKTRLLRHAGYMRPVIAMVPAGFCVKDENCYDALLDLPLNRDALLKAVYTQLAAPEVEEDMPTQDDFENSAIFTQLQHSFLLGLADSMKEIERAFAAEDWENAGHLAHALKGTAASFGYSKLAESSKQIESLLRVGYSPAAQTGLNELRSQTASLLG